MDYKYQRVPQNDLVGIQHVKRDYETSPARGLAHGLQKDAIQNGVGAARIFRSLDGWQMVFELVKIKGKDALVFQDQGTIGLTGEILSHEQIREKSAKGELDSTQNLSRFLSVFESGGNIGPGSYGRGKLVFQACSETYTILCDSLREDNIYIAFKRTIINNELVQSQVFRHDEARKFIQEETGAAIKPLDESGTRVLILDLDTKPQYNDISIKQIFLNSFDNDFEDPDCELSFSQMIQETWWELLLKNNASIYLKWENKIKKVELSEPLKSILTITNKENGWRVYEKEKICINIGEKPYRIKRLRFTVAPQGEIIPENFRQIVVQRKKMKIGMINKNIEPDNKIKKRFSGIIEMDQGLEELMLIPENMTHYGYRHSHDIAIKQIRQVIRKNLDSFHEQLGITKKGSDDSLEKEIKEALKELNEQASELGLMTSFGTGHESKQLSIRFLDFNLPNPDSLRVEYSDIIGPIVCEIINHSHDTFEGDICSSILQQGNVHTQILKSDKIEVPPNESLEFIIGEFNIDTSFRYGEGIMLKVEIPILKIRNSRMLWLGIEKFDNIYKYPFTLAFGVPEFPRKTSKRVEVGEEIRNIQFKISNLSGNNIKANISLSVRRSALEDKRELVRFIDEKGFEFKPLVEEIFNCNEIPITEEVFGFFYDESLDHETRCCEIFLKITSAEYYPDFEINKGDMLVPRKKIPFWVGIDDPGQSIFSDIQSPEFPEDPRRSWFEGFAGSGYTFYLNQGHPAFERIKYADDSGELKNNYFKEEMLKQAFIISIQNENYKGIFEETSVGGDSYSKILKESDSNDESIKGYEELMGKALHKLL